MRTSSRPSVCRARPTFSVEVRIRVARKSFSQVSTVSQRSSRGVRFQRSQLRQTTQRRPFAGSKARRRPTGKASTTSFEPRGFLQNMQVRYTAVGNARIQRSLTGTMFAHRILPRQRSRTSRRWKTGPQRLPFFEEHGVKVRTLLNDNGRDFCGREGRHPYKLFLQLEEIEHRKTKVGRPKSNGYMSASTARSWTST